MKTNWSMRRVAGLSIAIGVALSGCSADDDPGTRKPRGNIDPTASPLPTAQADLRGAFEDFARLKIPPNATEIDISAEFAGEGRPFYEARIETTRGGAEVFCTATNFQALLLPNGPPKEQRSLYTIAEKDIWEWVECAGSHPRDPQIQRDALVAFPAKGRVGKDGEIDGKDWAVIYARVVKWPYK